MSKVPAFPLSSVRDPNNSSRFLTMAEWDALWVKMNEERLKQNLGYADRTIVKNFIRGTFFWEIWQSSLRKQLYDFRYLDFFHEIELHEASFDNRALFNGVTFNNLVYFDSASFNQLVDFKDTKFKQYSYFNGAKFINNADFQDACFEGNVEFTQVEFREKASFNKAHFEQGGEFNLAIFKGGYFGGAEFGKKANFAHAQFSKEAHFAGTNFKDNCSFESATFTKTANFRHAQFHQNADFNSARFSEATFFNDAKFYGNEINFSQMMLSGDSNLIFEGAQFYHAVPDFRYLTRTPDIRFHNFSILSPKELLKEEKWDKDSEDKYRKLKELAIANHNHEYELKFNGYEMESKIINARNFLPPYGKIVFNFLFIFGSSSHILFRAIVFALISSFRKENKKFFNILNKYKNRWQAYFKTLLETISLKIYQRTSNFGQSIWLPIIWLAVLAGVAGWYNYFCVQRPFVFLNFVPVTPFPFFIIYIVSFKHFFFKSLASVLWFLFFLGVRNNFKIK